MNASTVIVDQLREASFVKREASDEMGKTRAVSGSGTKYASRTTFHAEDASRDTLHEERTYRILSVVGHYDFSPFCSSGSLKCGPAWTDKECTTKDLRRYACYLRSHRSKQFWHGCREARVVDSFGFQGGIDPWL